MNINEQQAKKNRIASRQDVRRILSLIQTCKETYPDFSKKDVVALLNVLRRYVLNVGGDLPWPPSVAAWAPGEQVTHKALYYAFASSEGIEDVADGIIEAPGVAPPPPPAPARPTRPARPTPRRV